MSPDPEPKRRSKKIDTDGVVHCIIEKVKARAAMYDRKPTAKQVERITRKCYGLPTRSKEEDKEGKLFPI